MTEDSQTPPEVDAVLNAFAKAHPRPDAKAITEWVKTHPRFADRIRERAASLLGASFGQARKPDPARYQAALDRAIERGRQKMAEDGKVGEVPTATFDDLTRAAGCDIPILAKALDIARVVIGEYVSGRMVPPAKRRFLDALAAALEVTDDTLSAAVHSTRAELARGQAKGDQAPKPTLRTYEEVVEQSPMSDERKAYWLERD